MTNIKCFIHKFLPTNSSTNATPQLIDTTFEKPLKAIVRREGSRMTDNATFNFFTKVGVENNDYVGYLQDDIDLDNLVALWNFSSSCRDESGFNHNSQNEYLSSYTCPINFNYNNIDGRVKNRLAGYFNSASVTFPNKNNDANVSLMNFSGDFSIVMSISPVTMSTWGTAGTQFDVSLFDKYDETTDYGIKLFIRHLTNDNWEFGIHLGNGTKTEVLSAEYTTAALEDKLLTLVLYRSGSTVYLSLDNTNIITQTSYTSDLTYTVDLIICSSSIKAYIYQTRVYTRALSSDEITKIYSYPIPITTLKFYGRVWKIESGNTVDTIYCNGLSEIILNTKVNETLLSDTETLVTLSSVAYKRRRNIYDASLRTNLIITNLLDKVNTQFFKDQIKRFIMLTGTTSSGTLQYYTLDDRNTPALASNAENFYRLKGRFIADGTLLDIFNTIAVLDDVTFTFMPTGVITFVKNSEVKTLRRIVTTDGGFNLNTGGDDKTMLVNQLTTIGTPTEFKTTSSTTQYWYGNVSYPTDTTFKAISSGTVTDAEFVNPTTSYSDGDSINSNYIGGTVDCVVSPTEVSLLLPDIFGKPSFCFGGSTAGTRLFVLDSDNFTVTEYALSNAYDLNSTITTIGSVDLLTLDSNIKRPVGIRMGGSTAGTRMYILDQTKRSIYQFPLSTGWDINTINGGVGSATATIAPTGYNDNFIPMGFDVGNAGAAWFILTQEGKLFKYTSTAWNVGSNWTYDSTNSNTADLPSGSCGIIFNSAGTVFWIVANNNNFNYSLGGGSTPAIQRYTVSSAWNTSDTNVTLASGEDISIGITTENRPIDVGYNGTDKMFVLTGITGNLNKYSTATNGVLTTFTFDQSRSGLIYMRKTIDKESPIELSTQYSTGSVGADYDLLRVYLNNDPPAYIYKFRKGFYGTVTTKFNYIRLIPDNYTGSAKTDSIIQTYKEDTSINTLGLQARKLNLPYLEIGSDLIRFNKKFILRNAYSTIPRRITLKTVGLINDILENNKIGAHYMTKSIGSIDIDGFIVPEYLTIKRIEYTYPENMTTIEIGDFIYDSFDLEKVTAETIRGIQST